MNPLEQMVLCSKNDLTKLYKMLIEEGLLKHIVFYQKDAVNYLGFDLKDMEEASFFIAEWINQSCGQREVIQTLLANYDFLSCEELFSVKQLATQKLNQEKNELLPPIQEGLFALSKVSNMLNLDGFVIFCMQEYREAILLLVEESLDEYLAHEEYLEFLHMLHHLIELEEPNFKCLSVVAKPDGFYRFYDEAYREITQECIQMFQEEFQEIVEEESEKQNDMLISLLVILVPETICLYGIQYIQNRNFLTTLQLVFEERIQFFQEVPKF
ncbi:MAG: sporulation protein YtxC [Clostridia bacterium]|nr:sporulation protein YtxC [Clostridia bacterium]